MIAIELAAATNERDPDYVIAVLGLVLYATVIAGFLVLVDIAWARRSNSDSLGATAPTMSLWAWSLVGIGAYVVAPRCRS